MSCVHPLSTIALDHTHVNVDGPHDGISGQFTTCCQSVCHVSCSCRKCTAHVKDNMNFQYLEMSRCDTSICWCPSQVRLPTRTDRQSVHTRRFFVHAPVQHVFARCESTVQKASLEKKRRCNARMRVLVSENQRLEAEVHLQWLQKKSQSIQKSHAMSGLLALTHLAPARCLSMGSSLFSGHPCRDLEP
eukprot:2400331-Amphidinium_carterae.1